MRQIRFVLLTALLLWLIALLPGPLEAREAPESIFKDIQNAVTACDLTGFERHVAVDALAEQGTDALITRIQQTTRRGGTLPPALGVLSLALQNPESAASVRVMLKKELAELVRYGVASGRLTGKSGGSVPAQGLLASLIKDTSTGAKTIRVTGKARYADDESGAYVVPVSIHDAGNNRSYPVQLHVSPDDESWKVDRVANMDALLSRFEKEAGN